MTEIKFDLPDYDDFTRKNRQWTRLLRLAHAKLLLKAAQNDKEKEFWQRVVKDNTA